MLILAGTIMLAAAVAAAQTSASYYGPQTMGPTNQGGPWAIPPERGLSYTHDLATGGLSLRLAPWGLIKEGRGPAIPYALVFFYGESLVASDVGGNTQVDWEISGPHGGDLACSSGNCGTWNENTPTLTTSSAEFDGPRGSSCVQTSPYIFAGFDGIGWDLGLNDVAAAGYACADNTEISSAQARGNPSIHAAFAPGTTMPGYVSAGDGTRYYVNSAGGLTQIEDANGNYVTVAYSGTWPDEIETWTDGAGAAVLRIYFGAAGSYAVPTKVETYSATGGAEDYLITWTQESSSAYTLAVPGACSYYNCTVDTTVGAFTAYQITSIELPDGSYYRISYDPATGAPSEIQYPTGGYVQFGYADAHGAAVCTVGSPFGAGYENIACDQLTVTDEYRNDGVTPSIGPTLTRDRTRPSSRIRRATRPLTLTPTGE